MAKIKCPQCGNEIELDKNSYNDLLNDVAGEEVARRVQEQIKALEEKYKAELALEQQKAKNAQDKEIQDLKQKNAALEQQYKASLELEKTKAQANLDKELAALKEKNISLEEQLKSSDKETQLAVAKALEELKSQLNEKEQEIVKLSGNLAETKKDAQLAEKNLKEKYEMQLDIKDEEIERWKNYRVGDSTKDLGENLEKYCHDAFDEIRADAYPNAYFEKDNESIKEEGDTKGSKGDFIFRDYSPDGIELVSIMFDMKTEKDTTENKKTNDSHLKKLDADRNKKGCEYAVLVSTLEEDSKLYNRGIVDVSHKYPKMYVIRPQFFLAIIGLIRNMALKSYEFKKQVVVYQNEHLDITNFENAVKQVADKITADYNKAGALYDQVDKMCDDMIKKITAFKDTFRKAQGHLGAAQNQLDNLSVRKLTKNNPTMKVKFDELKEE